ncbi:hypothetical protein CZ797_10570 [Pseudoalteromonas sp. JB197]|nr:hypothetical protein CZ797_10570 [Pseudoalteromonas sp. JB197]
MGFSFEILTLYMQVNNTPKLKLKSQQNAGFLHYRIMLFL